MARLIVLNGPPAVGKSTLARRYTDDHPFALALDLDSVRRLLGRWRDDPTRAGLLARAATMAMAREHLAQGHDVVLPQYLGNPQFLHEAEELAGGVGATFVEVVLLDDREAVVRRFHRRAAAAAEPAHVDAAWLVERLGGDDTLFAMYDRLLLLLSARPRATVIPCPEGAAEQAYRKLIETIDRAR